MKKAIAIGGSPRKQKAVSYQICYSLLKEIKKQIDELEYKIYCLNSLKIIRCKGCMQCFMDGSCPIKDDMNKIKKELLAADLIILASPVYMHNVTGDMKNFIDRLAYWSHLLRLVGKYGIIISVSSTNGNFFVNQYLNTVSDYWGIDIIGNIEYRENEDLNILEYRQLINRIVECFRENNILINIEAKEKIFQYYKNKYMDYYKKYTTDEVLYITQEAKFWHENGYFEYDSFSELFKSKHTLK